MSRHSHQNEKGETIVYGYDGPCQSYFIQKYDVEGEIVYDLDSVFTTVPHPDTPTKMRYSNGEMLEVYETEGVPDEYKTMLALDLPF